MVYEARRLQCMKHLSTLQLAGMYRDHTNTFASNMYIEIFIDINIHILTRLYQSKIGFTQQVLEWSGGGGV